MKAENALLKGEYQTAIPFSEKAAQLFKSVNSNGLYFSALDKFFVAKVSLKQHKEVLTLTDKVLKENSDYPLNSEKARIYANRGIVFLQIRKFKEALSEFNIALEGYRKDNNAYSELRIFNEIVSVYLEMGDYLSALEYTDKCINHTHIKYHPTANRVLSQINYSFVLIKLKRYEKAIQSLKKAEEINNNENQRLQFQIYSYYALSYYYLGKHKKATRYADKFIYKKTNISDAIVRDGVYVKGLCFFAGKSLDSAKVYLKKAIYHAIEMEEVKPNNLHNIEILAEAKKTLSKIELQLKNVDGSFALLEESNEMEKKSIALKKDVQLNKEVNTFELGEKKREVKNLSKEQLKNKLEIKEQQNKLILLLGGLSLLFVIFAFTYRSYVLKKKNAQELEEKKTIIENQNRDLEEALAEKGILLKEIHHRVKNNFQMVISLLHLQANEGNRENVDAFLEEATTRILSMSLIHQKLYESENLSAVDFKEYVQELADSIYRAFGCNEELLQFDIDIPTITFDIQTAIPLGLILNEMMINTLKYVHGTVPVTKIHITVSPSAKGYYELVYFDNGTKVETVKEHSFGTELITLLVQQIGGKLQIAETSHLQYAITFKPDPS
jgi:two-component sensor histidine kinase/Tfp pilus assembly protein PilF